MSDLNSCRSASRARLGAARRHPLALAAFAGGALGAVLLILPGLAQPDHPGDGAPPPGLMPGRPSGGPVGPGPRGPGRDGDRPPEVDRQPLTRDELRARLQRRLDDARLIEKRLEEGIASLDAGTAPEEVMRALFEPGLPREFDQPWHGRPEVRGPMTPEERESLMALVRARMPRVAEWITQLESEEPRLLEAVRSRLAPQLREIDRLAERDPQGAKVRTDELIATIGVMRGTRLYRIAVNRAGADSPEATLAQQSLREALAAQFDAHLATSQHEIGALGDRIQALRTDIEAQTQGREQFIDAAMQRIARDALRPPPELGEERAPPPGGPPPAGG